MNKRVPYALLAIEVEKLYSKEIPEDDEKAIEEHCQYIADYINACGWSEQDYIERWMKEQDLDN